MSRRSPQPSSGTARCVVELEWGTPGLAALGERTAAIVIVDVLSFSTSVDIAVSHGATVLPCPRWQEGDAKRYAEHENALLAGENDRGYSLRPASLIAVRPGERVVMPSPNGSDLSWQASDRSATFTACLRNVKAVAEYIAASWPTVGIVAAGERWPDGSTRFALEDWIGAGALAEALHALDFRCTAEAHAAAVAFRAFERERFVRLHRTASATELHERGDGRDVELAFDLNASTCAPRLVDRAYMNACTATQTT